MSSLLDAPRARAVHVDRDALGLAARRADRLGDLVLALTIAEEVEEPAAARAQKLAAHGAGVARGFVERVDLRVGDLRAEVLLVHPALVEERAPSLPLEAQEDSLHLAGDALRLG